MQRRFIKKNLYTDIDKELKIVYLILIAMSVSVLLLGVLFASHVLLSGDGSLFEPQNEPVTSVSTEDEEYDLCTLNEITCDDETHRTVTVTDIKNYIIIQAHKHGIDPDTAIRIAMCESSLNPLAENEKSTAKGVYQWLSGTWEWIGSPGGRLNYKDNINAFMEWYPKHPEWWEASKECWQ